MSLLAQQITRIFKSYDLRGLYPAELNEELAYKIGRCFVPLISARTIAIGRDMRDGSEELLHALAMGATDAGADVVDIGLVSTDALYFAVGQYEYDGGVMITASHNPAGYNGMKFTRSKAQAVSLDAGLCDIRDQIQHDTLPPKAVHQGQFSRRDVLDEFAQHCLKFVDCDLIKPLKVAIDAGNGMAGKIVPAVFNHLPCEIIPMYFRLDGTFPNHPANPLEPENMLDLQDIVVRNRCDLGVAFDGDADRMFIVDERGKLIGGDIVTALLASHTLKCHPGAKILYNLICSLSVKETIESAGGVPVVSVVGHSQQIMRQEDVLFGGEHSGHFYFKDNWYADSGIIALLQCLSIFSTSNKSVSEIIAPFDSRSRSGEINSEVKDIPAKLKQIEERYKGAEFDYLDGLTVMCTGWWMNVRASNTEPLLRLNLEADNEQLMMAQRDEVLKLIRS